VDLEALTRRRVGEERLNPSDIGKGQNEAKQGCEGEMGTRWFHIAVEPCRSLRQGTACSVRCQRWGL